MVFLYIFPIFCSRWGFHAPHLQISGFDHDDMINLDPDRNFFGQSPLLMRGLADGRFTPGRKRTDLRFLRYDASLVFWFFEGLLAGTRTWKLACHLIVGCFRLTEIDRPDEYGYHIDASSGFHTTCSHTISEVSSPNSWQGRHDRQLGAWDPQFCVQLSFWLKIQAWATEKHVTNSKYWISAKPQILLPDFNGWFMVIHSPE